MRRNGIRLEVLTRIVHSAVSLSTLKEGVKVNVSLRQGPPGADLFNSSSSEFDVEYFGAHNWWR
jgi:hypothetical protein